MMFRPDLWRIVLLQFLLYTGLGQCQTTVLFGGEAPATPNILWIVSEDNSAEWLGCYGNEFAQTPNLDQLAQQGFRYTKAFANAPVCAAQRAVWLSGMHSLSTGNHPMRSRYDVPESVKDNYYVNHLNAAGYHTHNGNKTDFNMGGPVNFITADSGSPMKSFEDVEKAPWRLVEPGKPFFCIINLAVSHESVLNRSSLRADDPGENSAVNPAGYLPNTPDVRQNYASYHKNITEMDRQVGVILQLLEEDDLADETIVVYTSDHGGVIYPSKRFIFHYGLHAPLILRIPERFSGLRPGEPGVAVEEVVSYIDLPATFLSLADSAVPENYQGRVFLGPNRDPARDWHFGYRERMDHLYDNARAVHDGQYLYIRNYAPYAPWVVHFEYHFSKYAAAREWEQAFKAGELPPESAAFWLPKSHPEELYDTRVDPDCLINLANDPSHSTRLQTMRGALRDWQLRITDTALIPEPERDRLTKQAGLTVFEYSRDPQLYNLPALLDAADLATAVDPAQLAELLELTENPHPGLRYWGAIGLLLLAEEPALSMDERLLELLEDESDEIRAYAAWALLKRDNHTGPARQTLRDLLENPSFSALTAMNILQWLGEDALPLSDALSAYLAMSFDERLKIDGVTRERRLPGYEEAYAQDLLEQFTAQE